MDTKLLRQKILDLAIKGKLVPQDPNDEPASVLLERIKVEKERLIKDGKIKRSKKTATTSDSRHYPFELPSGWVWCRLGEINDIARGGSPRPIKNFLTDDPNGVNWIKIGDTTKNSKYIESVKEKIRIEGVRKSRKVFKGDFLLTNSMSFGRPYILKVDGCIHDGWLVISPYGNAYTTDFLYYLLSSNFAYEQFSDVASGGVVTNLNSDKVADTFFPLPPISEQERIVKDIENWFSIIDMIEANSTDLLSLIKYAKNKVLDLAIHGKLVPQDPADEPASELLKRVNPSAEITCDNEQYENLPQNWVTIKLGSVGKWKAGATPSRIISDYYGGTIPWLKTGDLNDGFITKIPEFITQKALDETSVFLNPTGSVLIAMYGATIGKVGILTFPATTNQACCACSGYFVNKLYLFYFLIANRSNFLALGGGGAQPNISKEKIVNLSFPLPPLDEQHRIVDKIEELFAQLDVIENSLQA